MPNWCQNHLSVENPSEEFINLFKDGLSFEKIIPHPSDLNPDSMNGYSWRVENWGVKWDLNPEDAPNFNNQTEIEFDTAWSPPAPIIYELAMMFPTMKFTLRYFEEGNMFGGVIEAAYGEVINDEEICDEELIQFASQYFGYEESESSEEELDDLQDDDDEEDEEDDE